MKNLVLRFTMAILLITGYTLNLHAQTPTLRIENMTDEQLVKMLQQYDLIGLSDFELEAKARDKGIPTDQIMQLQKRIANLDPQLLQKLKSQKGLDKDDPYYSKRLRVSTRGPRLKEKDSVLTVFGSELFEIEGLNFEGNISIPTPSNYVIGVNDELVVDVFGVSENTRKLKVNPEGMIRIPNLGPIRVAGLTMEQASKKIRQSMSTIYPAIKTGQTQLAVSLGQIRSIQVTLVGEVNIPGHYTLPSTATIMHAMYASGGPNEIGSYREIHLVRGGKTVTTFDLYDFLLKGDLTSNLLLQDDDVIRVPPYSKRVAVKGAVKKQAIFDVKEPDDAASVMAYAGGMADFAFKDLVRLKRLGNQVREIQTINANELKGYKLLSGDTLEVDTLAKRFANRVMVNGAVYYPGEYGLNNFSDLKSLVKHVQPKENAFLERAIIRRLGNDLSPSFIPFNVQDVLKGDSIYVFDKELIRENYFVTIEGEVNKPSFFTYAEGMRVQDLILMAKGIRDGATLQRIEISRRFRQQLNGRDTTLYSIIESMDIDPKNFDLSSIDLPLQPFDIVYIRRSPSYKEQTNIMIEGEVMFPGKYTLQGASDRLSEVIRRAGGLKKTSFPEGAMLIRRTFLGSTPSDSTIFELKFDLIKSKNTEASKDKKDQEKAQLDTALMAKEIKEMFSGQKRVAIDLVKALDMPNSAYDIIMEEGDILKVPRVQQTVQSFGEVNYPQQLAFEDGLKFKRLINASGGFTNKASKNQSYVLDPNGKVRSTTHFLFFKFYPKIKPGSEVYVPLKKERQTLSRGEALGITSGLVSLAGVMLAIINSLK
jgi:protein involved in polysaccharide export with SLBB domain